MLYEVITHRDGKADLLVIITERRVLEIAANFLGDGKGAGDLGIREEDGEFLAADPPDGIGGSQLVRQNGREELQGPVARGVSVVV